MRDPSPALSRQLLVDYFLEGATPRSAWKVGMEIEKMGRTADGLPIPYDSEGPSVRKVLESFLSRRGGRPVLEADQPIGVDAAWGSISLEPGGQVEWSSRPYRTLGELRLEMQRHLEALNRIGERLGIRWLDEAVDPENPVARMPWMPKERYRIMRSYLGERGRLAHRMMTQTASVQCAFDYADPRDWQRKFRAAAVLAPVAIAFFANSSRVDGRESGYRSYRQAIWRETDPARCGLPRVVFEPGFDIEAWLDWVLSVPMILRRGPHGLVPAGGVPFRARMEGASEDPVGVVDWETHASTIFTEVRSYTYIEVRSADLQPDETAFAVPAFWTGILYHDDALATALEIGERCDHATWLEAMGSAARSGLEGRIGSISLRDAASRAVSAALRGIRGGATCVQDPEGDGRALTALAERHSLRLEP